MKKRCELLAPAGGMPQLIAAVNAGANAVYLGGPFYNARMSAANFERDEMLRGIDYAHLRDARIYITMNTLLFPEELAPALEYASFLYEAGVDALILQDLGLAALIRRHLTDLPIHLSTQGSVYNAEGVIAAARLGFSRVVLAREMALPEIKEVVEKTNTEVEVFAHGALCFCYSGQCQMSRAIGGRSGNRGACAQPCRLPYGNEEAYPLSPKDLCTVDFLDTLVKTGIASLKLEGRMKSPEYVAVVTSIYRKYLDQCEERGLCAVSEEDRTALLQIYSRGSFSSGYLRGNPGRALLSGDSPKHQGIQIGRVDRAGRGNLVDIRLFEANSLLMGDGVEIRGERTTGNVITYREELPGGILRIGDIKGKATEGDAVYRTSRISQRKEAAAYFDEDCKMAKKVPAKMFFSAFLAQSPVLTAINGKHSMTVTGDVFPETARTNPLTEELVLRQLQKSGDSPFFIMDAEIALEEGIALPVSSLNALRREALIGLEKAKTASYKRPHPEECPPAYIEKSAAAKETLDGGMLSLFFHRGKDVAQRRIEDFCASLKKAGARWSAFKVFVPLPDFIEKRMDGAHFAPYIPNISKGNADIYIEENFDLIAKKCRDTGIAIGNLGWIARFHECGVFVYGDYGLNVTNYEAEKALQTLGVGMFAAWSLENDDACFGRPPLMVTEHLLDKAFLVDRKGVQFPVILSPFGDKSIILASAENLNYRHMQKLLEEGKNVRVYL